MTSLVSLANSKPPNRSNITAKKNASMITTIPQAIKARSASVSHITLSPVSNTLGF
jgi:hypothetical protein